MKKKLITLVLAMAMVFSVAACGAKDDSGNGDKDIVVSTETDQPEDVAEDVEEDVAEDVEEDVAVDDESILTVDDKAQTTVENEIEEISFSILDDGKEVLEKLGEPANTTTTDNFHTNTYYNSAEVTYCMAGDNEEIVEFKSFSDAWKTSKGITIGSTLDEIKKAYGEPSYETEEVEHCVSYFYDGYNISFSFNDNNEVTYFLIALGRG